MPGGTPLRRSSVVRKELQLAQHVIGARNLELARAFDEESRDRAVLRDDVVPLVTVTARAKLEGVDLQDLWRVIRDSAIQIDGASGVRYLKLPRTVWDVPKPAPAHDPDPAQDHPSPQTVNAAMARLRASGDDRIVCAACAHCSGQRCPGGLPIPDMVPNRCQHFTRTTQELDK